MQKHIRAKWNRTPGFQHVIEKKSGEEAVIAEYRALFEKEPTSFHGYLYGKLIKSPVEREKLFREIVVKDPGYVWGNVGLATALMDQDRLQEGIDACKAGMNTVSEPTELPRDRILGISAASILLKNTVQYPSVFPLFGFILRIGEKNHSAVNSVFGPGKEK